MWRGILVILISLSTVCSENLHSPRVKTEFGVHKGVWTETVRRQKVAGFLGIPYAKPPIGTLRFKNPEPWTKQWRKLRDSTRYESPCAPTMLIRAGNEDCLYLNVFTPQLDQYAIRGENETNRAVLVFLIGGLLGHSDNSFYDPYYLLDQDIVLVTVNYRYGIYGFFTTGDEIAPGNYGLKDVLEALDWLQRNIAAFGGDPDNVTLMGQGTEAKHIHILSLSEKSEGLFHRYITQSGTSQAPWAYRPRNMAKKMSMEFAADLDCNKTTSQETVECMRNVVLEVEERKGRAMFAPWQIFGPTDEPESEDAVITEDPKTLFENGKVRDIPWLTGVVAAEGVLLAMAFIENSTLCNILPEFFEDLVLEMGDNQQDIIDIPAYIEDLAMFYFDGNLTADCGDSLAEMAGDMMVYSPVYETVKSQASRMKSNVYFYNFAYQGTFTTSFEFDDTQRYGVCHGDEVNYLFPVLNDVFEDWQLRNTENDNTMINIVTEMWANFAKTGVPSARMSPDWNPYQEEQGYLEFGPMAKIYMEKDFLQDRMVFWHNLTQKYFRKEPSNVIHPGKSSGTSFAWCDTRKDSILKNLFSLLSLLVIPAILARL